VRNKEQGTRRTGQKKKGAVPKDGSLALTLTLSQGERG
jgi:hypothetical protein